MPRHFLSIVAVLALVAAACGQQTYPGNGSDCEIRISINDSASTSTNGRHNVTAGDMVTMRFISPGGTLVGEGFLGTVQLFGTGALNPIPVPGVGNFWFDLSPTTATALLFDGLPGTMNPLPSVLNGRVDFIVPPQLFASSLSLYGSMLVNDATNPGGSLPFGVADTQELVLL